MSRIWVVGFVLICADLAACSGRPAIDTLSLVSPPTAIEPNQTVVAPPVQTTDAATGHPFGSTTQVSTGAGPAQYPSLALDQANQPVISWTDASNGHAQIYLAHFTGAQWVGVSNSMGGGGITNATADGVGQSAVAMDAQGRFAVAYLQQGKATPTFGLGGITAGSANGLMVVRHDATAGAWTGLANTSTQYPGNSGTYPGVYGIGNLTWSPSATGAVVPGPSNTSLPTIGIAEPSGFRVGMQGIDSNLRGQQVYLVGFNLVQDSNDDNAPGVWGSMQPNGAAFMMGNDTAATVYTSPQIVVRSQLGVETLFFGYIRNGAVSINWEANRNWLMAPTTVGTGAVNMAMEVDNASRTYVAFEAPGSGGSDIYVAIYSNNGWTGMAGGATPDNVSNNAGTSTHPSIQLSATGDPAVVWQDETNGQAAIYMRTWDGNSWVESGGSASGAGISADPNDAASNAHLRFTTDNHAVIVWQAANAIHATAWY